MQTIDTGRLELLQDLLKKAKGFGATAADALLSDSSSVSVTRRLGQQESLTRSEESEVGLRVFVGKRQAMVSSSDKSPAALAEMAERAVAMARAVPEDAYAGIADPDQLATDFPDLELNDTTELGVERLNDMADAAEGAARAVKGITNSEGAEASYGHEAVYFAASNGFAQGFLSSGYSLSVSVIAGEDLGMETDYDFDSATFFEDLRDPADIGRRAGERAAAALNPRRESTAQVPVIFDRRVSAGFIGALAGAISGGSVARGTTILKDKMNQQVMPSNITLVDDPFLRRGARSHPFDGEGLRPQKRNLVDNGVLTGWILDLATARQLKLPPTGNAARGNGGPPVARASNFYMLPGALTLEQLIAEVSEGFLVTSMLGGGGSTLTGDYSRGASGFWIRNGKISHPVNEMTIAGNLKDMWMNFTPANDLEFINGIDAPSLRIEGMTVAGA